MKLVVTGGAGYIGCNIAALLLESGHEVIVLDNLSKGHRESLPKDVKFLNGGIENFSQFFTSRDKIDAIFHCAAFMQAGESVRFPEKYWQNNTINSLKLIDSLRNLGIKKLIFSSTAAVYGNPVEVPIKEDSSKDPTNPYGMTKLAVDMAITSESGAHGLAAASLRYFNVAGAHENYGERHEPETHIIPLALQAADEGAEFTIYGDDYPTDDGTCVRDYIHVRDLAKAHLLALQSLEEGRHKIYNLGSGLGYSNKQVIEAVERVTGKKLNVKVGLRREGDPAVLVASNKLAEAELGWSPEKNLEEMVKDAWEFYQTTRQ